MEIELTKFRYHPNMSEETFCFSATLHLDGKRRGSVSNAGRGGACDFSEYQAFRDLETWAKTLPPLVLPSGQTVARDADLLITELVTQRVLVLDRRKAVKKMLRQLAREATAEEMLLVGFAPAIDQISLHGRRVPRTALAGAREGLRKRGCARIEVYSHAGMLLEASGEIAS